MNDARAWLLAQVRRAERASLDLALLTNRGARYVAARAGLTGVRALLRSAVHMAEVWILARDIPFEYLAPLFAMRTVPSLISGIHWGALEGLRVAVREHMRAHKPQLARRAIEAWLALTMLVALALFASVFAFIYAQPDPDAGIDGLYGTFALVIFLSLAMELYTRSYHSGTFALGRVYRPVWSMFLPELVELLVLVKSYPALGPFALHLTVLLAMPLRGGLALYYARRSYQLRSLSAPRPFRVRALRSLSRTDLTSSLRHALAVLPLQLDRMLLIALLRAAPPPGFLPLSAPYYALRPVLSFAQGWARNFFADFVRLDSPNMGFLRLRFERLLRRMALFAAASCMAVALLGSYLLYGPSGLGAACWLVPLVCVRSYFAVEQVRGFAYGALAPLMRTAVVVVLGLLVATRVRVPDRAMLMFVTLVLAAAQWAFGRVTSRAHARRAERVRRLSLSAWLYEVSRQTTPVRIAVALVDRRVARPAASLQVIAASLATGHVTRAGLVWLMWWEPEEAAQPRLELARVLAGSVEQLALIRGDSGVEALSRAISERKVPPELAHILREHRPHDRSGELRDRAREMIDDVQTVDMRGASLGLDQLSPRELAIVRRALVAQTREQYVVPSWAGCQVAVYAPRGEPELLFVWRGSQPRAGTFARLVRTASWRDSLAQGP
jgi:hypothetical protein